VNQCQRIDEELVNQLNIKLQQVAVTGSLILQNRVSDPRTALEEDGLYL
jgi:hypothetical protein